ncbi:MAG: flagellar hook-basal body complex protein FliE [Porticoccus sp.]
MTISSIQSTVQQIQTIATQAAGKNEKVSQPAEAVGKDSFVDELHASIDRINQLQKTAGDSVKAFELGDPNMSLNDVMLDKQKAGLSFEMGVQVRNRFIQSYKEIMNMQV